MQQYPEVLADLSAELAAFKQGSADITEDTELLGDLELDSLQVMNLLLRIEDRFDISIPVSILPDVRTVKDLALQIANLAGGG